MCFEVGSSLRPMQRAHVGPPILYATKSSQSLHRSHESAATPENSAALVLFRCDSRVYNGGELPVKMSAEPMNTAIALHDPRDIIPHLMKLPPKNVTQLLLDWNNGNSGAVDELMPIVYRELRRMAKAHLFRERPGHTLQATALI